MEKTQTNEPEKYERTISLDLFNAWQKFKRRGDPEKLAIKIGFSKPVIERALKFGYVKTDGLGEGITEFFKERLDKEKGDAAELMSYETPKKSA